MTRILYAIQGTGNGHISRAMDVAPELEKYGQVDYLVSGAQVDIALPQTVRYKSKGLSFYFGKNGGINFLKTFTNNSSTTLYREVRDFPIDNYDLIINDFEPITAWSAKLNGKKCVALSHQSALLSDKCPKPKSKDVVGKMILKNYAPASKHYGFHFNAFDSNIHTPVIRKAIRSMDVQNHGHYTVYLPAYSDHRIIEILSQVRSVKWEVFSKHSQKAYEIGNINLSPVSNQAFVKSMVSSEGVLCGAGFETPAEALFLGKKLMVIPMRGQYEQHCNAAALQEMGIPVVKKLKGSSIEKIKNWVKDGEAIQVNYPDELEKIVAGVIETEVGK
ncbi:Glycosyltransferase [Fulvivirga imtechensis AK7]|uniref:Glycosyltransferase n=1 Tax=Fulvivirga imtechensis AK7 TaxID=1237149 RepID=L8JR79_9BACT|nr:glycosyltransferase family protein [Fulvivirga imtechensis]ELR71481.1 Glycosyltransferase [Fulvivirga imtechensis AK7]